MPAVDRESGSSSTFKPRLGIDCDGVVADMNGYCLPIINSVMGTAFVREDWNDWHVGTCFGPEAEDVMDSILGGEEVWSALDVFPHIPDVLDYLSRHFDLYMVTAMHYRFNSIRRAWVAENSLPFRKVICASDKARMCIKYGLSGFIEDNQDKARSVARAGIDAYLVARPYNEPEWGILRGDWQTILRGLSLTHGLPRYEGLFPD